jgi:pimeloyl-ACP methyl ester carboxylesterase
MERGIPVKGETESTVLIPGPYGRLAVQDRGQGKTPVLFVHGNGGSSTVWEAQFEHVRVTRRANRDYSPASFAADVEAVAEHLELDRMVLVGHSIGGPVIAACADRFPHRVAGLLFVDSVGDLRDPSGQDELILRNLQPGTFTFFSKRWFERLLVGGTERTRTAVLSMLADTGREPFVGAFAALVDFDVAALVAAFEGPSLHVYVPYFNDGPTSLHGLVPDLPRRPMTGVSHWPMMDRPAELNEHLDEFLVEVDAAENGPESS